MGQYSLAVKSVPDLLFGLNPDLCVCMHICMYVSEYIA